MSFLEKLPVVPEGIEVTDIVEKSAQFPGAVRQGDDLRVHYQAFKNHHDTLETGVLGDGGLTGVETISGNGEVLYPVSCTHGGAVWYAWSETESGEDLCGGLGAERGSENGAWNRPAGRGWKICVRRLRDGVWSETLVVDRGEAVFYPFLFVSGGELQLLWTRQRHHAADVMLCALDESGAGESAGCPDMGDAEKVSVCAEAYRPTACEGGDGRLYLAYDGYEDGAYHAFARVRTESGWSCELRIDDSASWVGEAKVIRADGGATICWYSYDYDAKFQVCSADLCARDGSLSASEVCVLIDQVGWYMDIDAKADERGLQVLTYSYGRDMVLTRCRQGGGEWRAPVLTSFDDVHGAVHPSLFIEDGVIVEAWQFCYRNGHQNRNASVVLTKFTPEDLDRLGDPELEIPKNNFCMPIQAEKRFDRRSDGEVAAWLERNGYGETLLFGDIHGQSGISDGMGRIDQYYRRSRAKADLQFSCLTDHDCFPDWISQSEWELMRTTARLMDSDGELTCLLSYEWTPNEYQYDFGHKNVYFRDDEGDIFRSGEAAGITPTDLYATLRKYRAICIPHHPAADWGSVSAATDWSFHDDEVERLAEIMSRHAPYEDFEAASRYTKNIRKMKNHSVQDALARGYHMGFTAGSDSHQMDHGLEGGIVAVFAKEHTRAGIWDAMYERHTYGTTGARILLSFRIEGAMMGSELVLGKETPAHLAISVLGTDEIRVDLLRNNEVIRTWEPGDERLDEEMVESGGGAEDYYYVRVTQRDEHMAWGSPIWVRRI